MMKNVAAILKYTSLSGPPLQIRKRTRLAQLTRHIRNRRDVTFSIILEITLFAPTRLLFK